MTDWTSRCESGNCLQTRRVHLADGGEYVELRDTEVEGTLLVTVAAWQAHEAALRAEGRRLAADEIRASAAGIILRAEAEAGVDGAADHPFLLGCEYAAQISDPDDPPRGHVCPHCGRPAGHVGPWRPVAEGGPGAG